MEIVTKPWGVEKWLYMGKYVLKEIFMKSGHQSSLQYHNSKIETNYILQGVCELDLDGKNHRFKSGDYFHIEPKQIHRVYAVTDLKMVEASTPEVDDVVRLQDDYNRGNGRIESEHQ